MNYFRYKLLQPSGGIRAGVVRLPYNDLLSAITYLERDNSTPIYVKRLGPLGALFYQLPALRMRRKITRLFQAEFLRNVSLMLRSGITVTTALQEAAGSSGKAGLETDIEDIVTDIRGGSTLSEAAEKHGHIFPQTVVRLIRLGENTGKLDEMLLEASGHLKRIQEIINDTRQALLYPCFVFASMGAGLLFWFYYVVPKIIGLFIEMDVTLPALTVFLVNVSTFVQNHFIGMMLWPVAAVFVGVFGYKNNRKTRKAIDTVLLKLPVAGTIISASTMASITEHFSLLLNAGIDLPQSIDMLKYSIGNEVYRGKLAEVRAFLDTGEGVAASFRRAAIFPPFVVRMINVGELSGSLPQQLSHIAEDYRDRLSVIVGTIGKMIEPVVLVVAGIMFAIIVGGLFLPVYDLVNTMGGR